MEVIKNSPDGSATIISVAKPLGLVGILGSFLWLGAFGIILAIPIALFIYTVVRTEKRLLSQGDIVLRDSGFVIEKHSKIEVPWSSIDSIEEFTISAPKGIYIPQLMFKLADCAPAPDGYPVTTENSIVSKHIFGSGVFFANIYGYELMPKAILDKFNSAHVTWKSLTFRSRPSGLNSANTP